MLINFKAGIGGSGIRPIKNKNPIDEDAQSHQEINGSRRAVMMGIRVDGEQHRGRDRSILEYSSTTTGMVRPLSAEYIYYIGDALERDRVGS